MNHQTFPWLSFGILMGAGSIAMFMALPRPLKSTSLIIACVLLGICVGMGLLLSQSAELNVFVVKRDFLSINPLQLLQTLGQAALIGGALGSIVLAAIRFLFMAIMPVLQRRFTAEASTAIWKRVLVAFDSAILEEYIFRLFLFSLLIWITGKIWQIQKPPNPGILWTINLLMAIVFGAAHLPQWSTITPLTPLVILSVVFLNSVGGLTFGYLYFSIGLEAAIVAHFVADIVLHVIGPIYLQT